MKDNILVVDDEHSVLSALYRVLRDEADRVFLAQSAEEGLEILESHRCKVVICDHLLQGVSGVDFLQLVRQLYPSTVRILLTGHATPETAVRAVNEGEVFRLLTKPWHEGTLRQSIQAAVARYNGTEEKSVGSRQMKMAHESKERLLLEKSFPGINRVERDPKGYLRLESLSDQEITEIRHKLLGKADLSHLMPRV